VERSHTVNIKAFRHIKEFWAVAERLIKMTIQKRFRCATNATIKSTMDQKRFGSQ
jgi:hypothetical protein